MAIRLLFLTLPVPEDPPVGVGVPGFDLGRSFSVSFICEEFVGSLPAGDSITISFKRRTFGKIHLYLLLLVGDTLEDVLLLAVLLLLLLLGLTTVLVMRTGIS